MKYKTNYFEKNFFKKFFQSLENGNDYIDTWWETKIGTQTAEQLLTANDSVREDAVDNASDDWKDEAQTIADNQESQLNNIEVEKSKEKEAIVSEAVSKEEELKKVIEDSSVEIAWKMLENPPAVLTQGQEKILEKAFDEASKIVTWESKFNVVWFWWRNLDRAKILEIVNVPKVFGIIQSFPDIQTLYNSMPKRPESWWLSLLKYWKDFINFMKQNWYSWKWVFWPEEIWAITAIIQDTFHTQNEINNMNHQDKMKLLLDFSRDWFIDWKVNLYSKENNLFASLKDPKKAETFLSNLWQLWWENNINTFVWSNYEKARKTLELWLNAFASMPETSLSQLLLPKEEFQNSMKEILVESSMENNPSLSASERQTLSNLKREKPDIYKWILKWLNLSISTWEIQWIWAWSEWLNKLLASKTKNILNSLGFWVDSSWRIWVYIWHSGSTENWRLDYTAWLANGIPVATTTLHINEPSKKIEAEMQSLSQLISPDIKTRLQASATWILSPSWAWWMLSLNRVDENTSSWIEKMLKWFKWTLEWAVNNILSWKKSTDLWLTWKDKEVYDLMSWQLNAIWLSNVDKNSYVDAVLNSFKADLYNRQDWRWNLTWVSLWMIWPLLWAWFSVEKLTVKSELKWETIWDRYVREYNLTKTWKFERTIRPASEYSDKFESFDNKTIESVRGITNEITEKFNPTPENIRITSDLDIEINKLLNWNSEIWLDWAWKKFLNDLPKVWLKQFADNLPKDLNPSQKLIILQNMAVNMMRKEGLKIKDWKVTLEKSLKEYDLNRTKFFKDIFNEAFWWDPNFISAIDNARTEYLNINDWKNYTVWNLWVKEWVSFSWIEAWAKNSKNKNAWINPYVAGNIANFEWWVSRVPLKIENWNVIIDRTPNHIIEHYIKQMESWEIWYTFKGADKHSEMRNLIKQWEINLWDWQTIKINHSVDFAKDPECLNDKLLLNVDIYKKVEWKTEIEEIPQTDALLTYAPKMDKKIAHVFHFIQKDKPQTPPDTPPDEPEVWTRPDDIKTQVTNNDSSNAVVVTWDNNTNPTNNSGGWFY